jgi:hypothetical protein
LNSGCPTEKSLDKTTSSKSHAKQLKLKKSQCQWDFYKEEEAILSPLRLPLPPSRLAVILPDGSRLNPTSGRTPRGNGN